MIVTLLSALLVSSGIGFLTVSFLWPWERAVKAHLFSRLFLAVGLGHGITSCLLFIWLLLFGRIDRKYIAAEIIVLAVLLAPQVYKSLKRSRATEPRAKLAAPPKTRYEWLFPATFYFALSATVGGIVLGILREPHGSGWDAWAIYGVRARAIFRNGAYWQESFSSLIPWSHPDYPLLLPLSTARIWLYCGAEVTAAQTILSAILTLSTTGLLCSSVAALRSSSQGFLSGVVLLGLTTFLAYGGSGYADVPVMFFCTATFVMLARFYESGRQRGNYLILAGLAAGFAGWSKNEGLLFIAAAVVAHLLVTLRTTGVRVYLRELAFLSFGLVPVLAIIAYFKTELAPPTEYIGAMGSEAAVAKLLDYQRYFFIVRAFVKQIFYQNGYGVGLSYVMLIYLFCVGITLRGNRILALWTLAMCGMMAGYFWIYLTTPHELALQIKYSLDRLLLQQWPGFVLLYFLTANPWHERK